MSVYAQRAEKLTVIQEGEFTMGPGPGEGCCVPDDCTGKDPGMGEAIL